MTERSPQTVSVLADCHIHADAAPTWPEDVLRALEGSDLIVTLGDMGERIGLDALSRIAPLVGVCGLDDEPDPRVVAGARIVETGGFRLGCIFDPVAAGLASEKAPPTWNSVQEAERVFGEAVDVILWGSTHVPHLDANGAPIRVNPGSATVPDQGAPRSLARLILDGAVRVEMVTF